MDGHSHPAPDAFCVTDRIGLLGIDHVGLAVADLKAAIEFHTRVFGLRCAHQETNEDQGVREAMLTAGSSPTGEASAGTLIQLLAPIRADSPIARFLDRSGPGMHHVAYAVADIEQASAALRESGVRLLYETHRVGTWGSKITFAHPKDTGGVLVELVQRPDSRASLDGPPAG